MKTIRVEEVYRIHGTASVSVREDVSLEYVITRFAREPGVRGIFLIDADERFVGLITRNDLMKWAHVQLFGGKGRDEITISEIFRLANAAKAKDLFRGEPRELSVNESDTLQSALDKMLDYEEDVLPVVDNECRILGDLRLSEVLLKAIEVGKQARGS